MRVDLGLFLIKYDLNIKFRINLLEYSIIFLILKKKIILTLKQKCAKDENGLSPDYRSK